MFISDAKPSESSTVLDSLTDDQLSHLLYENANLNISSQRRAEVESYRKRMLDGIASHV